MVGILFVLMGFGFMLIGGALENGTLQPNCKNMTI